MSENCYWWGCAFIIICSLSGSAGRLILLYRWIYSMANWACLNITSDDFIVCFIWLFALRLKMLDRQEGHWKQSYEWYCMRFWSIYYHGVWIFYVYVCYLLAMSVCSLSCKPCVTWLCWMYSMVDRFLGDILYWRLRERRILVVMHRRLYYSAYTAPYVVLHSSQWFLRFLSMFFCCLNVVDKCVIA